MIEKFSRGMRIARVIRGMTAKEAAEKGGFKNVFTWNRLENAATQGSNPSLSTLMKVSNGLGMTVEAILALPEKAERLLDEPN